MEKDSRKRVLSDPNMGVKFDLPIFASDYSEEEPPSRKVEDVKTEVKYRVKKLRIAIRQLNQKKTKTVV